MSISRRELIRGLASGALLGALPGSAAGREPGAGLPLPPRPRADPPGRLRPSVAGLVRGGRVFTPEGLREVDVRYADGRIVEVGPGLPPNGDRVLDARDLLVLPGGLDPHTHLSEPWVDDFTTGSRAALAGGITTVGHIAYPAEGEGLLDVVAREGARVEREALADIVLHPVVVDPTPDLLEEIPRLAGAGHTTVKIYTVLQGFDAAVPRFLELLERCAEEDVLVLTHCEDAPLIRRAVEELEARGRASLTHFPESRPVVSEEVATERAMAMAEATGAAVYVVHLSSRRALEVTTEARGRGLPVFVETRPLYLHFTRDRYAGPEGPLWVGMPPIRGAQDRDALWEGLADGRVDVLATDHAPWTREQKLDRERTVANPRAGVNNLQVMLPLLFSEGVRTGRLSLERFVEVTAANPARLMGLYPRKGAVAAGSDADLVLWDPDLTRRVNREDVLSAAGFSVFEGWEVTGWPVTTLRRGEVMWEGGEIHGTPGTGRLLARGRWEAP